MFELLEAAGVPTWVFRWRHRTGRWGTLGGAVALAGLGVALFVTAERTVTGAGGRTLGFGYAALSFIAAGVFVGLVGLYPARTAAGRNLG